VFNAVAPNPVSQSQLMAALSCALKRPYFLPPIPSFLIKLGAGEMSDLVLDSHWVSTQKVLDQGYKFQFTDVEKAIDNLLR
jgi:NAD dependent epimerase/dehydratase family enzyme